MAGRHAGEKSEGVLAIIRDAARIQRQDTPGGGRPLAHTLLAPQETQSIYQGNNRSRGGGHYNEVKCEAHLFSI